MHNNFLKWIYQIFLIKVLKVFYSNNIVYIMNIKSWNTLNDFLF